MDYQVIGGIIILLLIVILFSISYYQRIQQDNVRMSRHIRQHIKKKVIKNTHIMENFDSGGKAQGLLTYVKKISANEIYQSHCCHRPNGL